METEKEFVRRLSQVACPSYLCIILDSGHRVHVLHVQCVQHAEYTWNNKTIESDYRVEGYSTIYGKLL